MAVEAAHPRAMHGNLAAMEADLAFGLAPAVTDAASTATMRRAGELLCVRAQHLLDGSDRRARAAGEQAAGAVGGTGLISGIGVRP